MLNYECYLNQDLSQFVRSMYAFVKASKKVPARKDFKEILLSTMIIWIQLCHYSRLLSVNEGMLNTLTIGFKINFIFSIQSLLDSLSVLCIQSQGATQEACDYRK